VQRAQIEMQLLEGCRRLARKGFLNTAADSFSMRIPASMEMILASGCRDWLQMEIGHLDTVSLLVTEGLSGLHASIYQERPDVGAVTISSPKGVRLLAHHGCWLPPLFDEQVRHVGLSTELLESGGSLSPDLVRRIFRGGANAALFGEQLLCLGITCERVLCNTELYEKCAQAFVLAKASGNRIGHIPAWVRLIATRRLLKEERRAAESYRKGLVPQGIGGY